MTAQTTLTRSSYGEILTNLTTTIAHRDLIKTARDLIAQAAGKNLIPRAYDDMAWERVNSRIGNKRIGTAIHHEIYDINPAVTKVLVCCREVEVTRYGIKTLSKTYYLVSKHGKGVKVAGANKAVAAKAAKQAGQLIGYAIEVVTGKARLKLGAMEKREGYKALTTDADGNLISVWDGSPWPLGKTRVEKATDDHSGGFYYYRDLAEVLAAATSNDIFGEARAHRDLIIARVEVSGCEHRVDWDTRKICATRIKPVEIVCAVI